MKSQKLKGSKLAMLLALVVGLGLIVVACSGGGGSSSPTAPPPAQDFGQQGASQSGGSTGGGNDGFAGDDPTCVPIEGDDDGDGVPNEADNCPAVCNPLQEDNDGDLVGDACDDDDDNDGVLDDVDNCPFTDNPLQEDNDGDLLGDVCDDDDDNDGVLDVVDNCPFTANADQADSDGDGAGDVCDLDDDNDGVDDGADLCPGTAPGDPVDAFGCSDAQVDGDSDGVCDVEAPSGGPSGCTGSDECDPSDWTQTGEDLGFLVDPLGCSVADYCSCEAADNHGHYVSCVTQTAQQFRRDGLITNKDKSDYVTEAAQSTCGM